MLRLARGLAGLVGAPRDGVRGRADLVALGPGGGGALRRRRAGARRQVRLLPGRRPRAGRRPTPTALGRVLDNLMRNAVSHAGRRGTVTVRVTPADGRAEVRVRDGGRGVSPGTARRSSSPASAGRPPRARGSGLGLAIAREIAEEHGGTLTLDPAGPGACFRLRLPLAGAPADDAARHEAAGGRRRPGDGAGFTGGATSLTVVPAAEPRGRRAASPRPTPSSRRWTRPGRARSSLARPRPTARAAASRG